MSSFASRFSSGYHHPPSLLVLMMLLVHQSAIRASTSSKIYRRYYLIFDRTHTSTHNQLILKLIAILLYLIVERVIYDHQDCRVSHGSQTPDSWACRLFSPSDRDRPGLFTLNLLLYLQSLIWDIKMPAVNFTNKFRYLHHRHSLSIPPMTTITQNLITYNYTGLVSFRW